MATKDICKFDDLGSQYDRPIPKEIKMYFDANTGRFNAEYKYEQVCFPEEGRDTVDVFEDWIKEMKNKT